MKYIYHHLGLGDHIICNGLVRNIVKKGGDYSLFVYRHNMESVKFMYRDLDNLSFIDTYDDGFILEFIKSNNVSEDDFIRISLTGWSREITWDQNFYFQHGVDFKERWDSFHVVRDEIREKKLYDLLNPEDEDFILIHNKGSDEIDRIDYFFIDDKFKKIYVESITENIFDYLLLIERAKEIHCIQSSFHHLVDSFDLNSNLFFHTKKINRGAPHKIKDKWRVV